MLHNDVQSLESKTREKVLKLLSLCENENIAVTLGETKRDFEVQIAYFLRGRIPNRPSEIQRLQDYSKKVAWPFTKEECLTENTWTLNSNHLDGRATDLIVWNGKKKDWDCNSPRWKKVLQIARDLGFKCGADWPQNDYPHIEYKE